jgi:hypothetical protein
MRKLTPLIIIMQFLIFSLVPSVFAEIDDHSVSMLLDKSGLTKQIAQIPSLFKAGIGQARQQGTDIPDQIYAAMTDSIDETIDPGQMLEKISLSLKTSLNESQLNEMISWYNSELGRTIVSEEEQASTPEAFNKMMNQAQELTSDPKRVEIAKRFDKLLGATEMGLKIQEYSSIATFSAIMAALYPDEPLDIESFRSEVQQQLEQGRQTIEQMSIISSVYAYRNIPTMDLNKYEQFLNTPTFQLFNTVIVESLLISLEKSIANWADAIAQRVATVSE